PALVEIAEQAPVVQRETFAPILYVMKYRALDHALELHNGVPHGLASSIFTNKVGEAEQFLSSEGSDCGIANVNINVGDDISNGHPRSGGPGRPTLDRGHPESPAPENMRTAMSPIRGVRLGPAQGQK